MPAPILIVKAEVDLPSSKVKAWVLEAMVMVPDWSGWPIEMREEEADLRVRSASEVKEVLSMVRVAWVMPSPRR